MPYCFSEISEMIVREKQNNQRENVIYLPSYPQLVEKIYEGRVSSDSFDMQVINGYDEVTPPGTLFDDRY